MLDKQQIGEIFLFEVKMSYKAAETTCNINNASRPGTANEHIVQWWFKFCKGDESQRWQAWWLAVRSWQWSTERIIKADPLTTTQEVAQELNIDHSTIICHLKQNGKVKKLNKWMPHKLTTNLKKSHFLKCPLLLFYATTTNHFLIWLWCDEKWILHDNQLTGWTKKKLQSTSQRQTCTKKWVMVSVWWSEAHLTHYSFLNPSETITSEKYAQQTSEMHEKLQRLLLALVNSMEPIPLHNNAWPHVT